MRTLTHTLVLAALSILAHASSADTRQLFNGVDLTGWRHVGSGRFVIEDGSLRAVGGVGLLWYEGERFGDAVVRVVYKVESRSDNSGVFVRIPEPPEDPWMPVNKGLEVQINGAPDSGYFRTGAIYTFSPVRSRPEKVGEWNTMEITLDGPRTTVYINGVLVSEYKEGDPVPPKKNDWDPDRGPRPDSGYVAIQNHPHGETVYFKEFSVSTLPRRGSP